MIFSARSSWESPGRFRNRRAGDDHLENPNGAQRSYTLRIYRMQDETGEKQLLEYLAPADVRARSSGQLRKDGPSQMWLYMPALGRERRIART